MIIYGDCRDKLKELDSESVQCCVTSPPYWGLRDYGTGDWEGGDKNCSHKRDSKKSDRTITGHKNFEEMNGVGDAIYKTTCNRCGAKRVDLQLGLEETPEEYTANMVEVFSQVKRVLRDDGTLWLNLGDSYSSGGRTTTTNQSLRGDTDYGVTRPKPGKGIKPKDLIGIPWRVAFALQADGWYLRQDIIWHKPNPMPESVTDRCTKAHEYIFLMSKSEKYFFDSDQIKEKAVGERWGGNKPMNTNNSKDQDNQFKGLSRERDMVSEFRNKRSVWTVNTKPYPGSHFAVFPQELIEPCIQAGSKTGDVVLDPFFGSGTTGEVAERFGRDYIGIELNEEYKPLQQQRCAQMGLGF
jgi:DNA modification methylase|tara:strand:- start:1342 stop:2400 length:1059 start_codon:yes stop_codon:yes gene_type:complete